MPGSGKYARCDIQLADWARSDGLAVSVGQIARWRQFGLLPQPTSVADQLPHMPPSRPVKMYLLDEEHQAQANVRFLAAHTQRGMPIEASALLMFGAGIELPPSVVVSSVNHLLSNDFAAFERYFRQEYDVEATAMSTGWDLGEDFDIADAVAKRMLAQNSRSIRKMRRWLRDAGLEEHVGSAIIGLVQMLRGVDISGDLEQVQAVLIALGGPHLNFDQEAVAQLANLTIRRTLGAARRGIPADVTQAELDFVRQTVTHAEQNVCPSVLKILGEAGDLSLTQLARMDDPRQIALTVAGLIAALHESPQPPIVADPR